MLEAAEENCQRAMKCKKCGLQCGTYFNLDKHRGSENCKKREAEQKGEEYIPKSQRTRYCDTCEKDIKIYNWKKHLQTKTHTEINRKQTEPAFYCQICEKTFGGNRPKVMLKKHLSSKKHLKRAQAPKMGYVHNACCTQFGFEQLFLEGPSEKRQIKVV